MRKLKVVFVTTVFSDISNGPGTYANLLWERFRQHKDIEFHLVAPNIPVLHERLHSVNSYKGSVSLYKAVQKKAIEVANRLGSHTIIHVNSAHYAWMFKKYTGPVIVQINDYDVVNIFRDILNIYIQSGLRRTISLIWRRAKEARVAQWATLVICNSRYTYELVTRNYNIREGKAKIIYKAVDINVFLRPRYLSFRDSSKERTLVFVGTVWETKGLDILLTALSKVILVYPDCRLVVVGTVERQNNRKMIELSKSLGISGNVDFVGSANRDELPALYWNSDIAVLPSRREALGVVVLEAMAAGVPVVASNTGGIPEIISDEICGVLFTPGDSEMLANSIISLLDNKNIMNSLSKAGIERAKEFSSDNMVGCVFDAYISLDSAFA